MLFTLSVLVSKGVDDITSKNTGAIHATCSQAIRARGSFIFMQRQVAVDLVCIFL